MHTLRSILVRKGDISPFGIFLVFEIVVAAMLVAYAAGAA